MTTSLPPNWTALQAAAGGLAAHEEELDAAEVGAAQPLSPLEAVTTVLTQPDLERQSSGVPLSPRYPGEQPIGSSPLGMLAHRPQRWYNSSAAPPAGLGAESSAELSEPLLAGELPVGTPRSRATPPKDKAEAAAAAAGEAAGLAAGGSASHGGQVVIARRCAGMQG